VDDDPIDSTIKEILKKDYEIIKKEDLITKEVKKSTSD
jgi:hypothetical protein